MSARGMSAFHPLSRAEEALVAGLDSGTYDRVGGGLPEPGDDSRQVRAELIRLLLMGGPDVPRLHETGIRLGGAWISGRLDLEGCRIGRDIGLADCRFDFEPVLRSAVIDSLALDGSVLPGLSADRIEARGDIYLRGDLLPARVPATSLLILRDGEPGASEVTLSPLCSHDQHCAEIQVVVQGADHDATFDTPCVSVGTAVSADWTLGGLCDFVEADMPRPVDLPVEGATSLKAALIQGLLHYTTADPLG